LPQKGPCAAWALGASTSHGYPIIIDPLAAVSILEDVFECINGEKYGTSFLSGALGRRVAGTRVTIVDDGTIPGGFGTTPFDGEGVRTRRTAVIENGVLRSCLLNISSAKRLGLSTTGSASRGLAGRPGIGPNNFFFLPGDKSAMQIIGEVREGLYVTEFLGAKANIATGAFSRGAAGFWIKSGALSFPVSDIEISGNLKDMLLEISEIGCDLIFRGAVASPTIRIDGCTVRAQS